jgi:hypothetical protein
MFPLLQKLRYRIGSGQRKMTFNVCPLNTQIVRDPPKTFESFELIYRSRASYLTQYHVLSTWNNSKIPIIVFKVGTFQFDVDLKKSNFNDFWELED